jgi:hypothetical protein
MKKYEFDEKKQKAAISSIEKMCFQCEKHTDECPVSVALGELKQEHSEGKRPNINYKDFELDSLKAKTAISKVEYMCLQCKEHTDECPIVKTTAILQHYV